MYLGYVEDDESVEMIARKFAQLEEMQRAKQEREQQLEVLPGEPQAATELTLEEQEELFRQTSYFSVRRPPVLTT
jgi:hypothetical protein